MLWETDPKILRTKYDILSLNINNNTDIINKDNIPPQKLNNPAIGPLVINTKDAFKIAIVKAGFLPKKNSAYITAILESPSLIPDTGIPKDTEGSEFSTTESTKATAKSNAVNTKSLVF